MSTHSMADLGEGPLESRLLCGRYLKRSNVKQAANSVTDPITAQQGRSLEGGGGPGVPVTPSL